MLRNAWQQVPDAKYARHVFERAKDLKELMALVRSHPYLQRQAINLYAVQRAFWKGVSVSFEHFRC